MPPKQKRKILTSEEVLKDIQKLLVEEDNENISDEDVNLDKFGPHIHIPRRTDIMINFNASIKQTV